ncbi:hypothetical protein EGW08_014620, partial [Elysia chlorotica]
IGVEGFLERAGAEVGVCEHALYRVGEQAVRPDGLAATEGAPAQEVRDYPLHIERQFHLHGHPLERCLLLYRLDVVNSQTDLGEEIHEEDAHDDEEDDEDDVRGGRILDVVGGVVEDGVELKLSDHHHRRFDERFRHRVKRILKQDCEGDDEEEEDDEELAEGEQDVGEHDHVDAEPRELLDEEHQVYPGQKHGDGAQVPLPLLQGPRGEIASSPLTLVEADDEKQRSDVDDPLDQVGPAQVVELGLVQL